MILEFIKNIVPKIYYHDKEINIIKNESAKFEFISDIKKFKE